MLILTRRAILLAGAGFAAMPQIEAASGDFWNKKAPSQWSSEEIAELTTKSPWAKEVTATMEPGEGGQRGGYPNGGGGGYPGGGGGYPGGGGGYPRIGGIGMPRRRGGYPGGGRPGGSATSYKGTIRWESAKPILEATKTTLPDAFKDHYVISVSGIPLRDDSRSTRNDDDQKQDDQKKPDENFDAVKQLTTLKPRDKELAQAGVVQRASNSWSTLLFGFSKDAIEITKKDWYVVFETRLGRLSVKTRFEPGKMLYHKELAV